MERLSEIYWELQTEDDPVGLEEFVDQACRGQYGTVSREDLRTFLREVEARLVLRIEQGEASAHDAAARDDLIDETRGWIEDLLSRYCEG